MSTGIRKENRVSLTNPNQTICAKVIRLRVYFIGINIFFPEIKPCTSAAEAVSSSQLKTTSAKTCLSNSRVEPAYSNQLFPTRCPGLCPQLRTMTSQHFRVVNLGLKWATFADVAHTGLTLASWPLNCAVPKPLKAHPLRLSFLTFPPWYDPHLQSFLTPFLLPDPTIWLATFSGSWWQMIIWLNIETKCEYVPPSESIFTVKRAKCLNSWERLLA